MIKCHINDKHTDWDEILPHLEYAYNSSTQSTTKLTPFYMMFGRHPKVPEDLIQPRPEIDFPVSNNQFVSKLKENIQKAFEIARTNTEIRVEITKTYYERNHIACKFEPSDLVWVRNFKPGENLCAKFCSKYKTRPYKVMQRINDFIYRLRPYKSKGRVIVMNRIHLKRHKPREVVEIEQRETTNKKKSVATLKAKAIKNKYAKIKSKSKSILATQHNDSIMRTSERIAKKKKTTSSNELETAKSPTEILNDKRETPRKRGRPRKSIETTTNNLAQPSTINQCLRKSIPRQCKK